MKFTSLILLLATAHSALVRPARPLRTAPSVTLHRTPAPVAVSSLAVQGVALNTVLAGAGTLKGQKMLTNSGLANGWLLGVILWSVRAAPKFCAMHKCHAHSPHPAAQTLGWRGWTTCTVYLLAGSFVTKVKKAKKEAMGIAEARGGRRGPENVWGAAATAAFCALATLRWPARAALLNVGFVASLATKLSDTFASEIGKAYGTTPYLITTFKAVAPGTEGAVSLEGTAAGVVGSLIIAGYAVAVGLVGASAVVPCLIAAFVATNIESLIGATMQGGWMTNEVVNFINTLIGAAVGIALAAR